MRNAATHQGEHSPQTGVIVGLVALVIESTIALLALAAVGFITSIFLARVAARWVRSTLWRGALVSSRQSCRRAN